MKLLNVDISTVDERTSVDRLVGFSLNWSIVWFSESIIVTGLYATWQYSYDFVQLESLYPRFCVIYS